MVFLKGRCNRLLYGQLRWNHAELHFQANEILRHGGCEARGVVGRRWLHARWLHASVEERVRCKELFGAEGSRVRRFRRGGLSCDCSVMKVGLNLIASGRGAGAFQIFDFLLCCNVDGRARDKRTQVKANGRGDTIARSGTKRGKKKPAR